MNHASQTGTHPTSHRPPRDTREILTIEPWPDPVVERDPGSHPTASAETLVWWTPVLGPTAAMMAQRFAAALAHQPRLQITTADVARTFGMGNSNGRVRAAIARLERFDLVTCHGQAIYLRTALAPLSRRHLDQLPSYLRELYETRHR
jgi:hypothetical protein